MSPTSHHKPDRELGALAARLEDLGATPVDVGQGYVLWTIVLGRG